MLIRKTIFLVNPSELKRVKSFSALLSDDSFVNFDHERGDLGPRRVGQQLSRCRKHRTVVAHASALPLAPPLLSVSLEGPINLGGVVCSRTAVVVCVTRYALSRAST